MAGTIVVSRAVATVVAVVFLYPASAPASDDRPDPEAHRIERLDPVKPRQIELKEEYSAEYVAPQELPRPKVKFFHDHPGPDEIGLGPAITFFWPDLGGVYEYIAGIEDLYRSQGHRIPQPRRRVGSMSMAWGAMRLWYWPRSTVQLDIGTSTGTDIKIQAISGSYVYLPSISGLRWIRPYAALGLGFWQFRAVVDYAPEIYPERITASGANWGVLVRQGIQFWPPAEKAPLRFSASLYFEYLISPGMDLESPDGITGSASFQGRSVGLRVEVVI